MTSACGLSVRATIEEQDVAGARLPLLDDDDVRVLLEVGELQRVDLVDVLRFAGEQCAGAHGFVRDELVDHLVEIGRAGVFEEGRPPVVVGVLHQRDVVLFDPLLDHEGTGADWLAAKLGQPHFLHRRRRNDAEVAVEPAQERGEGPTEHQLDGVVVDDLGVIVGVDLVESLARDDDRFRIDLFTGRVQLASLDHAIEGELDRLGVERGAIVEGHTFLQFEGVRQSVVRDFPRFGQPGIRTRSPSASRSTARRH